MDHSIFFHNDFLQIVELQNFINKNTDFIFKQLLVWNKRFNEASNKGFLDGFVEVNELRNYQKMAEYCLYYVMKNGEKTDWDKTGWQKVIEDINNFETIKDMIERNLRRNNLKWDSKELLDLMYQSGDYKTQHSCKMAMKHKFKRDYKQFQMMTEKQYNLLNTLINWDFTFIELQEEYKKSKEKYKQIKIKNEEERKKLKNLRYTYNNQKIHHSVMNYEIAPKQGHMTPKPVKLLEYIILTSSNENDTVLDCFMGSGSTGVSCKHLNRNFIGIEIDEDYYKMAKNRIDIE